MKIKKEYQGAFIKDTNIGRRLEVNEKNLPILLDFGHDYLIEEEENTKEEIKKKLKNDVKVTKKRNKRNSNNVEGTSNT